MKPQTRVIVGMSGGVDSSVAAYLLQQQGYAVEGVFMQNWDADQDDPFCRMDQDQQDAKNVCERLQIPFHMVRFAEQYWDNVFQHFLQEYASGRTPNPDILCNKEIKFKAFLNYAMHQGADYIATGHYARIEPNQNPFQLLKAIDKNKDQSYFLYTLQSDQLARTLFPLGNLVKSEVRKIAEKMGFANHAKKDSTGICFIGERKFKDFLSEYLLARPGDIETEDGKIIGRHSGLMFYTLGQRRGIGIGGRKDGNESPWYVLEKDISRNALIVGQSHDHPKLFCTSLRAEQLHWVAGKAPHLPFHGAAKTRYRQTDAPCVIENLSDGIITVHFQHPQWAVTPGQSAVFYDGEICLGGGVIKPKLISRFRSEKA